MSYNDIIKKLESIGIEIDYLQINVEDLNGPCNDRDFEAKITHRKETLS